MPPSGVATWTDPDWLAGHLARAEARLAEVGRRRTGDVEQRAVPWSTVIRIPTNRVVAWSKANGPGPFHEGPLLDVFAGVAAPGALLPLTVDAERGWLLLDDRGPTLRTLVAPDGRNGDTDLARWARILPAYAALQRHMERYVEPMLAAGVPDERPGRLPETLARLLETADVWARVDEADRPTADAARRRLRDLAPVVGDLAADLAASAIPSSIEHGDLHGNNIVIGDDGAPRFYD